MIPRVKWADAQFDEAASPFLRGKQERPIRVTFHTSSFSGATQEELRAIELLRELANLPEIEAIDTSPSSLPHLEIGVYEDGASSISITVTDGDQKRWSAIQAPGSWLQVATKLANQTDKDHPDAQSIFQDILVTRANHHLRYDLLITLSRHLLENRNKPYLRSINPRTPLEAAKIIGLLLRSRGNYVYKAAPKLRLSFNRGLFYWVLARHRLPNLWRYFSACVHAEIARQDDILYLGQSVLVRCVRALEARDATGAQFHVPQNNDTRDVIMYHFDYLTLLLVGVFDAQARIARRAYRIDRPDERNAGFRRKEFQDALKQTAATTLYDLVSGQYFSAVMTLLHELRNTIHGAALPTLAYEEAAEPQASFVTVLPQRQDAMWQAAQRCGPPEKWGFLRTHELLFEPYTYAVTLVDECLNQIDAVAAATDITGLFPNGYVVPQLPDKAPDDDVFEEAVRQRLAILG